MASQCEESVQQGLELEASEDRGVRLSNELETDLGSDSPVRLDVRIWRVRAEPSRPDRVCEVATQGGVVLRDPLERRPDRDRDALTRSLHGRGGPAVPSTEAGRACQLAGQ